jgi:membrane associated rhomboid family serine protease
VYGRGYGSPGFGFGPAFTPPIIQQLLIANVVVFVAALALPIVGDLGALVPRAVWQHGFLWQPFTYMWLHGGLLHLLMNMLVLWMFGSQLAMAWGPQRFLRFYLLCGVGAGLVIATLPYLFYFVGFGAHETYIPTVGASGAIYGVVLAYSLTWPDRTVALMIPPVVFRAIWLIPIMFLMNILFGGGNVSHVGHLGGVLAGWLILRRDGGVTQQISWASIKYRFNRWRMRRRLRAVQYEEYESRRRKQDRRFH